MTDRTAKDLVEDMLRKGRSWIDILAVAAAARDGKWRKEAEAILSARNLIPKDEARRIAEQERDIKMERPDLSPYANCKPRRRAKGAQEVGQPGAEPVEDPERTHETRQRPAPDSNQKP